MNQEFDVFHQLMTDTLCLRKLDGQLFENIKACVSGDGILINDVSLPIEVGDRFTRKLPSGLTEQLIVNDSGYCERFMGMAAHYQVKVRRAGTERSSPRATTYDGQPLVQNTFYGPVGNLAQNSEQFSQTASIGLHVQDLTRLVTDLTDHLDDLNLDARQKQRAEVQIAALKAQLAGEPDSSIVSQAVRTLRNITEGAIGSLLATAAVQPAVWQWIYRTLVSAS